MKVVVHDASILIDLTLCEAVDAWFATGIETWTSDLIYPHEIVRPEQRRQLESYVVAKKLLVRKSTEPVEHLFAQRERLGRGLSFADVSALLLTQELGADSVLATGDQLLRSTATREKVKVCGILGLFDQMVEPTAPGLRPTLPRAVAAAKLKLLMEHPECRLPQERCAEKIKQWRAKGK